MVLFLTMCIIFDDASKSFVFSFVLPLSGPSTRISSLAPSLLSSATFLYYTICTLRIASLSLTILSFLHYRYLDSNQLTGTIPPQLGNLSLLEKLYAENNNVLDIFSDDA